MKFSVQGISKSFNFREVLKDISFSVPAGKSLALTGHNGSGKTTLLRILCNLLRADAGKMVFEKHGNEIKPVHFKNHFSLVGPYLQLYDELTAFENLEFLARLKNIEDTDNKIYEIINMTGLKGRAHDFVKTYSSGMKQRLKYAFALLSEPDILFLDEPTSNLDKQGIEVVYNIMEEQKAKKILIFATNDESDLKFADGIISVNA
ncbi:MAG: ABC transporter ATP-binding protein [Calditrichae bacterium]|nr:ABC transporter ATP-binding protein [Calditrichota bacterium]MCB9059079.1 ABC transporter ATP-binding protein [Calditrichia bacterium]